MDIGARLKEERETQNISLDELQETTKIQKRYLTAIEEGNFDILPGKFYARAFIKEYAIAVGLDPDELLEGHKDEVPSISNESSAQYSQMQRSRASREPKKVPASLSFIPRIIVILLVIGILFVAWTLTQKSMSDKSTDPIDKQDEELIRDSNNDNEQVEDEEDESDEDLTQDQSDEEEEEPAAIEFDVIEEGTGSPPESILGVDMPDEELLLTLETEEEVYIEITGESGESYFQGMFNSEQSPEELTIEEDKVYFNIGNSVALTMSINGTELPYPIEPQQSVHQKLWLHINKES